MSIAARALPLTRPVAPRRHLRPVTSAQPRRIVQPRSIVATQAQASVGKKIFWGSVAVLGLNLIVCSLVNASIYEISSLKRQTAVLETQTQIVQQQVDSLRSPQNLANSARSLGMIVNSNPVFLKVASGKVLGSAIPASVSASGAISSNLIANSALVSKSNPTRITATKIDVPKSTSVTQKSVTPNKSGATEVVLPSGGIPASPTH